MITVRFALAFLSLLLLAAADFVARVVSVQDGDTLMRALRRDPTPRMPGLPDSLQ